MITFLCILILQIGSTILLFMGVNFWLQQLPQIFSSMQSLTSGVSALFANVWYFLPKDAIMGLLRAVALAFGLRLGFSVVNLFKL